jgi:hypothetical protein
LQSRPAFQSEVWGVFAGAGGPDQDFGFSDQMPFSKIGVFDVPHVQIRYIAPHVT